MPSTSVRANLNRLESRIGIGLRRQGRIRTALRKWNGHELADEVNYWSTELKQYRDDFPGYCEYRKIRLTPQQLRVGEQLMKHRRVLVPSGNSLGKSYLASVLASWHYDCWNPGITIVTAPNLKQVNDIVFRELRALRLGDPNFLRKAPRLESSNFHFIDGLTASSPEGFQGRHDVTVMVIFDEAEAIGSDFWRAAETMAHYFVAIYNPTTTSSQAAVEERSGLWPIVHLNALEHPNIAAELRGEPPVVPNAVRLHEVKARLAKWARRVDSNDRKPTDVELDGVVYRPGPAAEARVLGRRPTSSVDTVFSAELLKRLKDTKHDLQESWPLQIGVDVARFGDDMTVIHARRGFCSVLHESHNGLDTVAVARRVAKIASDLDPNDHRNVAILVDDTGVGGGVTDQLRAMGYDPSPINFGSKPNFESDYPNIRSELWFWLAELADRQLVDLSRLDQQAVEDIEVQLLAPRYTLDSRGRRVVDPKHVTKAVLGRSPDDVDALCLAYYSPPSIREMVS